MTTPILFFIVLYSSIYIVEGIILYIYCKKLFSTNKSKKYIMLCYTLIYGLLFAISFAESIKINMISFSIANFLLLIIVYNTSFGISLLHALITNCVNTFSELIVMGLSQQYNSSIRTNTTFLVILTVTSKII